VGIAASLASVRSCQRMLVVRRGSAGTAGTAAAEQQADVRSPSGRTIPPWSATAVGKTATSR
jgi:hypothetical protein